MHAAAAAPHLRQIDGTVQKACEYSGILRSLEESDWLAARNLCTFKAFDCSESKVKVAFFSKICLDFKKYSLITMKWRFDMKSPS